MGSKIYYFITEADSYSESQNIQLSLRIEVLVDQECQMGFKMYTFTTFRGQELF